MQAPSNDSRNITERKHTQAAIIRYYILDCINQHLCTWWVFVQCVRLNQGITIPFFLLGSSLHPSLHPKFLVTGDNASSDTAGASETTSLLHDADEGEPVDQDELDRLMSGGEGEQLSSGQRDALLDDKSGLKNWGRGKVNVYNQGSQLIICDENGELKASTRADFRKCFR